MIEAGVSVLDEVVLHEGFDPYSVAVAVYTSMETERLCRASSRIPAQLARA